MEKRKDSKGEKQKHGLHRMGEAAVTRIAPLGVCLLQSPVLGGKALIAPLLSEINILPASEPSTRMCEVLSKWFGPVFPRSLSFPRSQG